MSNIPLFVKAGSIVPMGKSEQYTGEDPEEVLEIRIYRGTDGQFVLYEDEGDNYNYEQGIYSTIAFSWNDSENLLTIGDRKGSYPGMPEDRKFNVVLVDQNKGIGTGYSKISDKEVRYTGEKMVIDL